MVKLLQTDRKFLFHFCTYRSIERAFCSKPPCRQCHRQPGRFNFLHPRKARRQWLKVTTQSQVICSDYKSPCPLGHDWIDPTPGNSPHFNLKKLDVSVARVSYITKTTSVVKKKKRGC